MVAQANQKIYLELGGGWLLVQLLSGDIRGPSTL